MASCAAPSVSRRFRPQLEWLEERDCPSTIPISITVDFEYLGQNEIRVYGQVTAEDPEDTMVYSIGAAYGMVTPDANGDFSMNIHADSLGTFDVYALDWNCDEYHQSSVHQFTLTADAPVILDFWSRHIGGNVWEVEGIVSQVYAGLTITFNGQVATLNMMTTEVQANGSFILVFEVMENEEGWTQAQFTDWWGQESNDFPALIRSTYQ